MYKSSKGSGSLCLRREARRSALSPAKSTICSRGLGLGLRTVRFRERWQSCVTGGSPYLAKAVDPVVVDRNSLSVELLGDPAVAVPGVLQQDPFDGPPEAAPLLPKLGASPLTPLPVGPKLGFA